MDPFQSSGVAPKTAFLSGVVGGVLLSGTIAFIIFFSLFLTGNLSSSTPAAAQAPTPTAGAPTAAPPSQGTIADPRPVGDGDHIRGDVNAPITVIEYSDLECPFCQRFHGEMQRLVDTYPGKVRWVYRHFPLTSLHRQAQREAEATECVAALGGNDAFWKFVDKIFAVTPSNDGLNLNDLPKFAAEAGVNKQQFEDCLNKGTYTQKVNDDANDAISSGGQGTPYSVFISPNGEKVPISGALPFEELQSVVESFPQS